VVFTSPLWPSLVVSIERVFASFRLQTAVEVLSLPLKDVLVTIVRLLPSADHLAVYFISPRPGKIGHIDHPSPFL